ncbi:MAG: D-alanyl-D-alanine carboxypeptidase family protein [Eubacteriales bacterium]
MPIVSALEKVSSLSAASPAAETTAEPSTETSASGTSSPDAASASPDGLTTLLDPEGVGAPEIDGKAYVLYDAQSGAFLVGNNQDTPLPPASITKVMTILLAFENLKMTDSITVTRDMYESIPDDYVRLGLVEGEVITVEEAIYACLLISANDAAMALAVTMGGSVEGFSKMMNERAVELGCMHTNFTNPYGLSDEKHVTTAHDMALMMAAALKNETYTKISTTANYTMPATNKHKPRNITNGNRFVSTTTYAYENYIGGKTGFTDISGHTIVAGARQNSRTLIGVILGASCSEIRYSNLIALFTYGFEKYSTTSVDVSEYAELQKQTVDQVTSGVSAAGYALEITDVKLNLNPYCTTTADRSAGGYSTGIDISKAVIQAGLSKQTLDFPVFRQYADTSKDQVGTLTITLCDPQSAQTAVQAAAAASKPKTSMLSVIIRGGIILLLLCILTFCIIIYVMLQKEKKRRKSRRRPRVL